MKTAQKMSKKDKIKVVNEICDNLQVNSTIDNAKKEFGEIEDKSKLEFLANLLEYVETVKEQNEKAKVELEYRKRLLVKISSWTIKTEEIAQSNEIEKTRTSEIIKSLESLIKANEKKIELFNSEIKAKIVDEYDFISKLNVVLGNKIGLPSYSDYFKDLNV